ncbi:Protein kinase-like domain [Penicillium argentinense]|uniref:Protein kinase-like domain n=1 Tax=Penicillium argentinense TaxID=1131581 RepID=A0A9W9EJ24_9EURO|nr:Protein kinase-like domain [Penicillium argentinense]KAJ5082722.1 Protein kinase-like domain [Penicillium argentinense]
MAVEAPKILEVGSKAWLGPDEYEDDSEFHVRGTKFLAGVNWGKLTEICSKHRHGPPSILEKKFSVGHFNMARRVVFENGMSWIARLRMQDLEDATEPYRDVQGRMSFELAWMSYLK